MKLPPVVLALALAAMPLAVTGQAPVGATRAAEIASMEEAMKLMEGQMARVRATRDPKQRERLLDQHMKTMHESLTLVQSTRAGEDAAQRMEILERRVDFTQRMLQQLLERRNFEAH